MLFMDIQSGMITATVIIDRPVAAVWQAWTDPEAIARWNIPFDHWWVPKAETDLRRGGAFCYRMEARDGSEGFDHKGIYDQVIPYEQIAYTLTDGRKSVIRFLTEGDKTTVVETFEPEGGLDAVLQQDFCQSVLNRFKTYTESGE